MSESIQAQAKTIYKGGICGVNISKLATVTNYYKVWGEAPSGKLFEPLTTKPRKT